MKGFLLKLQLQMGIVKFSNEKSTGFMPVIYILQLHMHSI